MASALGSGAWIARDADGFALAGLVAMGGFLVAEAARTAHERRLELGVAARMHAAAGLGVATGCGSLALWFLGYLPVRSGSS